MESPGARLELFTITSAFVLSRAGLEPALYRRMVRISTFLIETLLTRFVFVT